MFFFIFSIHSICILLSVAFFSLLERKILSYFHYRKGPNKVFFLGIFQPFADAMKLVSKNNRPLSLSDSYFFFPPIFMMCISLFIWFVYPFWKSSQTLNFSLLSTYVILSLGVYSLMFSGYFSKSKYSLIGALRAICQSLSYEVVLSFFFLNFLLFYKSASFVCWMMWKNFFFFKLPLFCFFLMTFLAELNRAPFDLSEGESELVSGYSVEYGGISYTLIFLSENIFIFFASFVCCFFFFKWNVFYFFKWSFICFFFIFMRGIVPRIRYDVLMFFCWKLATPFIIFFLTFFLGLVEFF